MTRVYLPTTLDRLRDAWSAGAVPVPDADAVVVAEGEDEESEYAALMTAADVSAELLAGPGRRVVVVAEVADPTAGHPVPLKRVLAVHADAADRPADADPDDDLAWYATQEVPDLLG
ncbi:hypothetical protein FE634_04475 [Nocardioides dongxiaopingii]|uniref:DUF6912 family protein n=1 Tax=Nocardioides TaxID=1839 RepID=UPI0010C76921|nr:MULTISPECIES: hypothetical protein [Nocardioides]QCW49855.1 hypothetical protein FE634_04475 [Nocardioides sp. S-1144]